MTKRCKAEKPAPILEAFADKADFEQFVADVNNSIVDDENVASTPILPTSAAKDDRKMRTQWTPVDPFS